MLTSLRDRAQQYNLTTALVAAAVLALAFLLGQRASPMWLGLLVAGIGAVLLFARPVLGLLSLVVVALVLPIEFSVSADVKINLATLLIPALLVVWLLAMLRHKQVRLAPTATNRPLLLFLLSSLLSLLIGRATWDPLVPIKDSLLFAQLGQWGIFAFSAGAFWLAGSLVRNEARLRQLTMTFLILGGGVAILRLAPGGGMAGRVATLASVRAPFWMLLAALAGGQLLFNRGLDSARRALLVILLLIVSVYAFVVQRENASNWMGVGAALGALAWLRFRRLRWPLVAAVVILALIGVLFPTIYNFAGGDREWEGSGVSRLLLIQRVVEVTMRNPITGLGPAAYRVYAGMKPLAYQRAYWLQPQVNSHNNYVDLFAHGGIVGLALFAWFVVAFARTAVRQRERYPAGFASGYVNGVLAAGAGSLVAMLFADWILPHVYNIGFPGFQASVLVWLFMGGLVALENFGGQGAEDRGSEVRGQRSGGQGAGDRHETGIS